MAVNLQRSVAPSVGLELPAQFHEEYVNLH